MLDKRISNEDQQLLHAAFSTGEKAVSAWTVWRANIDFDKSGARLLPLIPSLHQNLLRLGIEDSLLGQFKGIQRRTWYQNQIQIKRICKILRSSQHLSRHAICLPNSSLSAQYYANIGMRPIYTQFFIPSSKLYQSIRLLQDQGWNLEDSSYTDNLAKKQSKYHLIHNEHGRLSLRWRLFPKLSQPTAARWNLFARYLTPNLEDRFWDAKQSLVFKDVSTSSLNPTDQLFFTCILGQYYPKVPLWVADAIILLRHPQIKIDWPRFCAHCHNNNLFQPVRKALVYLSSEFNAPVPPSVIH